jgi:hypothetical protein
MNSFILLLSKKTVSKILLLSFLIPIVFFVIPTPKAHAQLEVQDILAEESLDSISLDTSDIAASTDDTAANTSLIAISTAIIAKNTTANEVQQYWLKALAWQFAKLIVKQITAQTVNWINSGFNGNPAYVTDPGQFFTNIGDQTVVGYLGTQGILLNQICTPFKAPIRLALIENYMQESQMGQCSIQKIIKNYDAFTQDFSQGGWDGWFQITQNMQNNPYGAYLQAQDQLSQKIASQVGKYQQQLNWGQGFLSYESCSNSTQTGSYTVSEPDANGNLQMTSAGGSTAQSQDCKTETPGSVIKEQLGKTLGSAMDQLNLVNDINQIVSALMVQGIKGIFGGISSGLRGLSQTQQNQSASLVQQLTTGSTASNLESINAITQAGQGVPSSIAPAIGQVIPSFTPSCPDTTYTFDTASSQCISSDPTNPPVAGTCPTGDALIANVCVPDVGSSADNTLPDYTVSQTCTLPLTSTNDPTLAQNTCNRIDTTTCQPITVTSCSDPLGANQMYY